MVSMKGVRYKIMWCYCRKHKDYFQTTIKKRLTVCFECTSNAHIKKLIDYRVIKRFNNGEKDLELLWHQEMLKAKRLSLLGGLGYLGIPLVQKLLKEGARVKIIDKGLYLQHHSSKLQLRQHTITKTQRIQLVT